ncbi:MAG TPA: UPF0179 family protein [Candidatus Thermoplasmatota archaeon]|nr:UPF0179 family protein [Candidatus Thermoplasmatota archaeon]
MLGELQAKVGERFVFQGPNDGADAACAPCRLKGICFNLEPGETFEVAAVRDKDHPCYLHEGGKVRVVEVDRATHDVILPARGIVEGGSMLYPERSCEFRGCPKWRQCVGAPLRPNFSYRVVEAGPAEPCPLGFALRRAKLAPK